MPILSPAPAGIDLGEVYVNSTALAQQYGTALVLGNDYLFPNYVRSGVKPWLLRTGQMLTARLVKYTGGAISSAAKKMVAIDPADPGTATALASSTILEAYPISEWVVGSVAQNALCWVITGGLASVILAASVTADITAGDYLNPSAATAGAVDIINSFTANKVLFGNIKNARLKATASATAVSSGGATLLVEVIR